MHLLHRGWAVNEVCPSENYLITKIVVMINFPGLKNCVEILVHCVA